MLPDFHSGRMWVPMIHTIGEHRAQISTLGQTPPCNIGILWVNTGSFPVSGDETGARK